ncbi:hypothetical protein DYU05_00630 [Mucilaginibacter terrenus]|uniref:DUF5689 domain-containing protein n=1 Tax=Mucilaginibacter terrenus TaxID=2482727 RepID=A0A3E2NT37_9SPHI|nr:DUF5689 domain-containing protein [Mucilaginibacter terrenus]RFZ84173.1 hypothetical protein DYU05_00630 [Mucilaginibacter terrenus]
MKKIYLLLTLFTVTVLAACKKNNYAEGTLSPIIAVVDLKDIYKGADVTLSADKLSGAKEIVGVVISDAASGNTPAGVLVVQNNRRNALRGIAVAVGNTATKYVPGDSVIIQVEGATLTRVNGSMRITGITETAITKVASGKALKVQSVPSGMLIASPDVYENTLVTISKAVTTPEPKTGESLAGDKQINDGFGIITLHTEATAKYAANELPFSANFTGIPVIASTGTDTKVQLWPRTAEDIFALAATRPTPIVITGYLTDPTGTDANYEYIQLKATKDIDFSVTSYSLITCNNAGTLPPSPDGWAQGGARTYKFNLTSGKVTKGQFFYVGGNKNIYGAGSTDISSATWINSTQYATVPGADGIGNITGNLLANSGNVAGIAVFEGTAITAANAPVDVIMYGGNGAVYLAGPPEIGYRITNTDYYSTINSLTRQTQSFYGGGTNTSKLGLPATSNFTKLGGVYDALTGRWTTGRTVTSIPLTLTTPLSTIESGTGFTTIQN